MKLSVTQKSNKAKLAALLARNCTTTIKQVLISKFAFGPERLPGLSRNGPQIRACFTKCSSKTMIKRVINSRHKIFKTMQFHRFWLKIAKKT